VLILLPPSEGKTAPRRGAPLDLDGLSLPALAPARDKLLDALVTLCAREPEQAVAALGLSPGLAGEVDRNAGLRTAPTVAAQRLYTGVLYEALDLAGLDSRARRRANAGLLIFSGLWGVVRTGDRLPAYRLPVGTNLPGIGPVAGYWRTELAVALDELAGGGLVLDLRSSGYTPMWRPAGPAVTGVRVLHEQRVGGELRRSVVSHFNKATKGRLVRALLQADARPRTPAQLAAALTDLGYRVEPGERPGQLDVVVSEL
jgi:cytoplasmic iron level regulating protein YaaA (DUF328/UPF0246 family)